MQSCVADIRKFILSESEDQTDAAYNRAALGLFDYQYRNCPPYRQLCDAHGVKTGDVDHWRNVPAVPAAAFKSFNLSCVPPEDVIKTFHSSGTTGQSTSRHLMCADALALYDLSLTRGFDRVFGARGNRRLWAMMPSPADAPHSSLSHMLGELRADRFFWDDLPVLRNSLERLDEPIILFGTAFAFALLFESSDSTWPLPPGSIVIETGGFKGRVKELSREDLYAALAERFGVALSDCYSEYGMSEMGSQFYGRGLDPVKRGPPWVRTRAIDPETGLDTEPGTPGILRHYDLANINSAYVLESEDYGYTTPDGFVLLGRAAGAEVRGCSLTVEALARITRS